MNDGVLRHRLGEHRGALDVGAQHLIAPPLVSHFVGGDVEGVVDRVGVLQARDEADALGERDRVRKGRREPRVPGKLDDAHLPVLVRREVLRHVAEGLLHRVHHSLHVVLVVRVVEDLDVHALPGVPAHRVARGEKRKELRNRRIHLVVEVPAPALGPLPLQIAGRDRDLVGVGADRRLELQPVGVAREVVRLAGAHVVELRHPNEWRQPLPPPLRRIAELAVVQVPERRELTAGEERAVVHHGAVGVVVDEPRVRDLEVEPEGDLLARGERRGQLVDRVAEPPVLEGHSMRRQIQLTDRHAGRHADVKRGDGRHRPVGQAIGAANLPRGALEE